MNKTIEQIRKILFKAYDEWRNDPNQDGHCKSSEGYISVKMSYPNYWCQEENIKWIVSVYSYVFGTSRMHEFEGDTLEEASSKALKTVKEWLKE